MLLTGFGQPSEPELVTDRPDQMESSVVVPPRYVQIETGWSLSQDKEEGSSTFFEPQLAFETDPVGDNQFNSGNPFTLRLGVAFTF